MAIGWIYLSYLQRRQVFRAGCAKVLDIGCQNLFSIPVDGGLALLLDNGAARKTADLPGVERDVAGLSARSIWPNTDGSPVYLWEFLDLSTVEYLAYDIFPGPKTRIVDLNRDAAPAEHQGVFDCVFNFGTTEHVFNQYNAFKVIHSVTRVDGFIFHQVPTSGYVNHGYWIYSPRMFLELAEANDYRVEAFWVTGPQGSKILDAVAAAPELVWDPLLPENDLGAWRRAPLPDGLINVLLRKTRDAEFRLPLDTTTTAGPVAAELAVAYGGENGPTVERSGQEGITRWASV